jgi:hypothetical protein
MGYVLVEEIPTSVDEASRGTLLALAVPHPNPMTSSSSRIEFTLPRRSDVRLNVYDLAGRRVAEIVNGSLGPGRHSYSWNGRAVEGMPVAAGVYVLRLETSDGVVTRKVAVLR